MNARTSLLHKGAEYRITDLSGPGGCSQVTTRLPRCLRILYENALRHADSSRSCDAIHDAFRDWMGCPRTPGETVSFRPTRVLAPESGGLPLIADISAMRSAAVARGRAPTAINPRIPLDIVVDHSLIVDEAGSSHACARNENLEMARNGERFAFLKWAKHAFDNLRVIPPGFGICHQVNFEYLADVVRVDTAAEPPQIYPDTLIGLDSHTPTINALGVLGWGVGGIEATLALMGEPLEIPLPRVTGCFLYGTPPEGFLGMDAAFVVVETLRSVGVVGEFIEFFGPGVESLPIPDRASISNMTPEYGATIGFFPTDQQTFRYLVATGRSSQQVSLAQAYLRRQGLTLEKDAEIPQYSRIVEIDLGVATKCVAGPNRPHQRLSLSQAAETSRSTINRPDESATNPREELERKGSVKSNSPPNLVAIAALASCTNTVNPRAMIAAALLARNAVSRGMRVQPWVKTSLTLGSPVMKAVLYNAGIDRSLDALGFNLAGFGCATCLGNSGALKPEAERIIEDNPGHAAWAVVSSNRNFEGRIHPKCCFGFLASPPLVVAYALAGNTTVDFSSEPVGLDENGLPVMLVELWPNSDEIEAIEKQHITPRLYRESYARAFDGKEEWQRLAAPTGPIYPWPADSNYLMLPPFLDPAIAQPPPGDLLGARPLLILGDSITTDHISPIGAIGEDSVAARHLEAQGVEPSDYNTYASRRVNHDVMVRGAFGSPRLVNELVPEREGSVTRLSPNTKPLSVFEAAMDRRDHGIPLIVVAGQNYGMGSSRDWAAKGTRLLGVRAVIAESFERIHRANLACMGVLPLAFSNGQDRKTLGLRGDEIFSILGYGNVCKPKQILRCQIRHSDGCTDDIGLVACLETAEEVRYFKAGGVLPVVLDRLAPTEQIG